MANDEIGLTTKTKRNHISNNVKAHEYLRAALLVGYPPPEAINWLLNTYSLTRLIDILNDELLKLCPEIYEEVLNEQ